MKAIISKTELRLGTRFIQPLKPESFQYAIKTLSRTLGAMGYYLGLFEHNIIENYQGLQDNQFFEVEVMEFKKEQ